jgi:uncharacterized protein YjbI with pentapeptide repeats
MRKTQQEQCSFDGATIFATDFEGSYLLQSTFHNTNIIASRFNGIRAATVTFKRGTMQCDRGMGLDFSTAHFNWRPTLNDSGKLRAIIFPSLNRYFLEFAAKDRTTFDNAILDHADFAGACLQGIDFARASLKGAVFDGANLDGAELEKADLECSSFRGTTLENARNLANARDVRSMDFSESSVTKSQSSTLSSQGALYDASPTIAKRLKDAPQCDPMDANVASPLPRSNDASEYDLRMKVVPDPDSPAKPKPRL